MSDWDFLHDMYAEGYTPEEIADAAATGMAPSDWKYVSTQWLDDELDGQPEDNVDSVEAAIPFVSRDGLPYSQLQHINIFHDLLDCAERHYDNTGRYLQIWGELGELYAEIKFGLCRHGSRTEGSDGTIAGKLVEVKTISPEKTNNRVLVKNNGDFEQLLIVKIDCEFRFKAKIFERGELSKAFGKFLQAELNVDDITSEHFN